MTWNWDDYSSNNGTETVPLLLSVRSQQLILSAMQALDFRSSWLEVEDAVWNDIEAAIAESYQEIIEEQEALSMVVPSFTVERTSTSFSLAGTAWQPIPVETITQDSHDIASLVSGKIHIAEAGWYSVDLILSVRNGTGASFKLVRLRNKTQNTNACIGVSTNIGTTAIVRSWNALSDIFQCNADDEFEFELYSSLAATTIESDGEFGSGLASRCFQAKFEKLSE